jgi:hypothetical protein
MSAQAVAGTSSGITWSPAVRVSMDSATSNLPHCLVRGDTINLVWFGIDEFLTLAMDGVEVSRSTDGGATFSPPVSILPFDICLTAPVAAQGGENILVAVAAVIDTSYGTFLVRSTDAGATWSSPVLVRSAAFPVVIAAENDLALLETIDPVTKAHVVLKSTNGGAGWVLASGSPPEFTDLLVRDGVAHGVGPASSRILHEVGYFSSRTDGSSWYGPEYLSSEDVTKSERGSIAINDRGDLFAVWSDTGDVTARSSRNNGIFWGPHSILSRRPGTVTTDIAADAEFVVVVWDNDTGGTGEIRLRSSDDFGETYGPEENPVNTHSAAEPAVVVTDSVVHLTWHEHHGDTCEVYYRRGAMAHNPDAVTRPPEAYRLRQNYPNPFNGRTVIEYELPAASHVSLALFDLLGRKVLSLVEGTQDVGRYIVPVDGDALPSGIYFYHLRTSSFSETKKLTVIR